MSTKKIKLTTSINKINAKTKQNKKKPSAKLKLILADPHKYLVPTLPPQKTNELSELIHSEINQTSLPGKEYAKRFGISLGMSSSLRAISNRNAAYVLISKSVKPKFILQQIAYFAKQKNSKTPIYTVSDLEDLSKRIFGVKSTIFTISNSTSSNISEWISGQTPAEEKKPIVTSSQVLCDDTIKIVPEKCVMGSVLLQKSNSNERVFVPKKVVSSNRQQIDNRIKSTSDYMTFSVQASYPKQDIGVAEADLKRGRHSMLKKFSKICKTSPETGNRIKKDSFSSYAKLKTLSFISDKNKSKKEKPKKIS